MSVLLPILAPFLMATLVAQVPAPAAAPRTGPELWAGHAVVRGSRRVPLLGRVETRTETFMLAEVSRTPERITLRQRACAIDLGNPAGLSLSLLPSAAEKLPPVELVFTLAGGEWRQGPSTTGWSREDVDQDGRPGMTLLVDAPVCSGKLFVGLRTTTLARGGGVEGGGLRGEIRNRLAQEIIETEGLCLSAFVQGSEDQTRGAFAFVPVSPNSTCATLTREQFPAIPEPR